MLSIEGKRQLNLTLNFWNKQHVYRFRVKIINRKSMVIEEYRYRSVSQIKIEKNFMCNKTDVTYVVSRLNSRDQLK